MIFEQIKLVQQSWVKVKPIVDKVVELFYGKLFVLNLLYKELFLSDMIEQGRKLMVMINIVVNSLNNLEVIVFVVQEMGKCYVGYGVKDEDYDVVVEVYWYRFGF